jgi:hypothetical protein
MKARRTDGASINLTLLRHTHGENSDRHNNKCNKSNDIDIESIGLSSIKRRLNQNPFKKPASIHPYCSYAVGMPAENRNETAKSFRPKKMAARVCRPAPTA